MWFRWIVGLLILFRIGLFVYYLAVNGTYLHLDSGMYIDLAENMLRNHVFSLSSATPDFQVQSADVPYGPEVFRTPGYPLFIALIKLLGMKDLLWVVFWQEIIYGLSVFLFYKYGTQLLGKKITQLGVIFLMIDPGGIAYPKLILSETLFLPFVFVSLFSIGLYLRQNNWRYLLVAGIAIGIGALIRPAIYYFPLVAAVVIAVFSSRNKNTWLNIGAMILSFTLIISPWIIRNYQIFGQYFFSGQPSNVLAHHHLPRVWEAAGVENFWEGQDHIRDLVQKARKTQEKQLGRPVDGVEFFKLQQHVAMTELLKQPKVFLEEWIHGTLKAMYLPFSVEVYNVYHEFGAKIPFPELFSDTGESETTDQLSMPLLSRYHLLSKLINFVSHAQPLYLCSLIAGILTMLFAWLGVFYVITKKDPFLWLMMLANFYYISIAGPSGHARFRLPVDVFWFVQAIMGGIWLWSVSQKGLIKLKHKSQAEPG